MLDHNKKWDQLNEEIDEINLLGKIKKREAAGKPKIIVKKKAKI